MIGRDAMPRRWHRQYSTALALAACVAMLALLAALGVRPGGTPGSVSRPEPGVGKTSSAAVPSAPGGTQVHSPGPVATDGQEFTEEFLAWRARSEMNVTPSTAGAIASFPVLLPDDAAMPDGASFKVGVAAPPEGGQAPRAFHFYYTRGIKIIQALTDDDPDEYIKGNLAGSTVLDLARPDDKVKLNTSVEVNGHAGTGHDPLDQQVENGKVEHTAGTVVWMVPAPAGARMKYVRYRVSGERLRVSELLPIANSMK